MLKIFRSSIAILLSLLSLSPCAWAELTIFDMRKNLPLSDSERVYRDFYINGGTEAGIVNGMIITVQRRMPLYDNYSNRSAGDLDLKVAKIKIIHTQKGISVARVHSEYNRDAAPLLEDNFIMIGDRIDLATAVAEKIDKSAGGESAGSEAPKSATTPKPEPVAAAIIPKGNIVVNSVDPSSENKKPTENVDVLIQK